MVVNRFIVNNIKEFILVNTHNHTNDNGGQGKQRCFFIKGFVTHEYEMGNHILLGGCWNQLLSGFLADAFGHAFESKAFHVLNVDRAL